MYRLFCCLVALTAFLGFTASAAHAQRDPFEPLVGEGSGQQSAPEEPGGNGEAPQPAPRQPETLANTGVDGMPWLALAYVLIALGLGIVVASRLSTHRSR